MNIFHKKATKALSIFALTMIFALSAAPIVRAQDDSSATPPDTTQSAATTPPAPDTSSDTSSTPPDTGSDTATPPAPDTSSDPTPSPTTPSSSSGSDPSSATGDTSSGSGTTSGENPPQTDANAATTTVSSASETSSSTDPSITTGNASSDSEVNNTVNTNQTDTSASSTTVSNTNDASTTNVTSSSADSGKNTVQNSSGVATITTGNAISQANVINVVNANITNSQGLIEFLNAFNAGGYNLNNLDLSFFGNSLSNSACSFSSCGGSLNVTNSSTAMVNNTVISKASTGGNTASSTGDTSISTGDAAASANVVNVVNTNITNSHYLLVALNNFGDLAGNIVLPSTSFFDQIMQRGAKTGSTSVSNDNTAVLDSTTTAQADSGNNAASSTGDSSISTGQAFSNATTYNQTNSNLTGGTTVFMLLNVFGSWSGGVQGLPAGLSWAQTQNGVAITGNAGALSSLSSGDGTTTVSNTNSASVNNNVQVYALTGNNQIQNASGTAQIATGNAFASANVVNLVNTNILGQNWILAIMNVFGNWSGNLDFGQPDLWIGAEAQTTNPTQPGSQVVYTFTVANHGNDDATNVILNAQFDPTMLTFDSGMTGTGAQWDLGTIPAGQTKQFSYTATAGDPGSGTIVAVPLVAKVTESQDDANMADNSDTVAIAVGNQLPSSGGLDIGQYQADPQLIVHKTASIAHTTAPATVNYTVTVEDPDSAGPAYNATLTDTLTDPKGNVIYNNSWQLDTINPGDDITLTYSVEFDASSTPGTYMDNSVVTGEENYAEDPYANPMPPASAVSDLEIDPTGEVLGASTSTVECSPLLTSYLTTGGNNNSGQVSTLQWFLNTFENAAIKVTGIYDQATVAAVKAFQQKYANDILVPWGMRAPSGNVYYTTENEINNVNCGDSQFALTPDQESEIHKFKTVGGTYGSAPAHSHIAAKPPKPQPIVIQSLPSPVITEPVVQPASTTFLAGFMQQAASIFGIPFAQAATRD